MAPTKPPGGKGHRDMESGEFVVANKGEELKVAGEELSRPLPGNRVLEWNVQSVTAGSGKKSKVIIQNIGSGKTTLLQSLSLRTRNWNGAIKYNGKTPGGSFFTASALVHQKEVIFGFMTPREHLTFQARARMSKEFKYDDIMRRVEEVIHEARLEKCQDTVIGGTDLIFMRKGLSGGERKRLALATELLKCPEIIFLDEPSSGLDSVMAETIVALLRDFADRGRIVITCVHCPSSDLMKHFTDLLLLTHDGRQAFMGPKAKAVPHFETLGYAYPLDYNPADYLLKVLSCPPNAIKKAETSRLDTVVKAYKQTEWAITQPLKPSEAHKNAASVKGIGANDWDLFLINCWRTAIQLYRDTVSLVLWGTTNIILGMLFGVLFLNKAPTNWRNLMGLTYAVTTASMMLGSMAMVVRFPLDWGPVVREYFAGSNAIGPYLCSRFILLVPLMYAPVLLATLIYWMTGLQADVYSYLLFVFTVVTISCTSLALGHFASCVSANLLVGLSALPAMSTPMILFSGLLYQRGTIPNWMSWIENVSIVNYGFSALVIQTAPMLKDGSDNLVLKFIGINPNGMWHDLSMLWVLFCVFVFGTYLGLLLRMRYTNDIA